MQIYTQAQNLHNHRNCINIKNWVREFLEKSGYQEVELPVLTPVLIPEPHLRHFTTRFKYFDQESELYLITSAELFSKRLLAAQIGSSYNITKCFRNSDLPSSQHHFEFTMLEYYRVNANYMQVAAETQRLLQFLVDKLYKSNKFKYKNKIIDVDSWDKITVQEAFARYAGIDNSFDFEILKEAARSKGYQVDGFSYVDIWSQIYTQEVEPNLGCDGKPTMIYDYPLGLGSTAKFNQDKLVMERFELYIAGNEIGNCYSELTDWQQQQQRLEADKIKVEAIGNYHHYDDGFIDALKSLPPCSGMAMGLERLAMVLLNLDSIEKLQMIMVK